MSAFEFNLPAAPASPLATLARAQEIGSVTPSQYVKQRISAAAASLSRKGMAAARVVGVNEALRHLTALCYETDSDGLLCNVDSTTHRLLIPAPWGEAGWRRWELRKWEARTLRAILLERQSRWHPGARPALFDYNHELRNWHLNLGDYPTLAAAAFWLERTPVTLAEWRSHATRYAGRYARG